MKDFKLKFNLLMICGMLKGFYLSNWIETSNIR